MLFRKLINQLDALELGYLLGAALPGALFILALNLIRLVAVESNFGILGTLDMTKSEMFLVFGLAAGGVAVLGFLRGRWGRSIVCGVMQIAWALIAFIEIAGHQFIVATGSALDYYLLAFSLENMGDNADVISSEISLWVYIFVPLVTVLVLGLPWLIQSLVARKGRPLATKPAEDTGPVWAAATLAVLLLFASTLPAYSQQSSQGARATTPTLAVTAVEAFRSSLTTVETEEPPTIRAQLKPKSAPKSDKKRNIVFLILESTRASAVTIYNKSLGTTPFLNNLATRSTVAENAYVVVPHSSKALTAILCGITPNLHMPITEAIANNIPGRCLADLLGDQGYKSIFMQSAVGTFENRYQLVENFGYDHFISGNELDNTGFSKANYFGYEDDIMLAPSREWLKEHQDKPIFATYFTLTPHHPYDAPRRYGRHDYAPNDKLNRYLNSVHYLDNFVKNIFTQYKELGLYENTIFVIVGDHGEGLGEHGRFQHDNVIYQEGVHVPMLIFDPQNPTPERVKYGVNHLDLIPTTLKRLGYGVVAGDFPGTPLLDVDHERPMRINCWYERRCMAQIIGDQKYIYHFGTQPDEFFDLNNDPVERHNLADSQDNLSDLRADLMNWRHKIIGIHQTHAKTVMDDIEFEKMPDVQHIVDAKFGDVVRLRGYNISSKTTHPGAQLTVTWYFESLKEVGPDWKLFVHIESNGKIKVLDHIPVQGLLPLKDWASGTIIADKQDIVTPKKWKPGKLDVYVGLWNTKTGERKKVTGSIPTDGKNRAKTLSLPIVAK